MQSPIHIYLDEFGSHKLDNIKRNDNLVVYSCQINAYDKYEVAKVKDLVSSNSLEKLGINNLIKRMNPKMKYFRYHIAPQRENGGGWRKLSQKVVRDLIKISYKHYQNGLELPKIYPCRKIGDYILENLRNRKNNMIAGEIVKKVKRLDRSYRLTDMKTDFYIKEMVGEEAKFRSKMVMNHISREIKMEKEKSIKLKQDVKIREIIPRVVENQSRTSLTRLINLPESLYSSNTTSVNLLP